ncbi:MAG: F0F1 ATP synthase subunit B [Kosmotoga sp.]|nr:MAG: F0F1 ATP synthase subunit B [Kosmotoga sp.]
MIELNLTSVIQLLNFLLLMWILKKLLYDRFFEIVEKRKKEVSEKFSEAEKLRKEAAEYKNKYEEELQKSKEQANELISNAEKRSEQIIQQAKEKAKEESARIKHTAQEDINNQKKKAIQDVQASAVEMAVNLVARFLGREMDEKLKRQYTQRMLNSVEKKKE